MANEKIEIDIVLNDGSVAKGFAKIRDDAKKTETSLASTFSVFAGVQLSNLFDKARASTVDFFKSAVQQARNSQDEFNLLATSLQTAGSYSEDSISSFSRLADEIERTTKFAAGNVIANAAMARNFTKTNEQAEKLVKTATDLAAATGIDLNTAVTQLGGTLTGTAGRLGKVVPQLTGLTEAALKSGAAIDIVQKRFSGSAAAQVDTFSGALAQASNKYNTFLSEVGKSAIRSPAILALTKEISSVFTDIGDRLLGFNKSGDDVFKNFILGAAAVGKGINVFLVQPFEVWFNLISLAYDNVKLFFDFFLAAAGKVAGAIGAVTKFFNKDSALADGLLTFNDSSQEVFIKQVKKVGNNAANVFTKAFDTTGSDAINNVLSSIENAVDKTSGKLSAITKGSPSTGGVGGGATVDTKALQEQAAKILELQDKVLDLRSDIQKSALELSFIDLMPNLELLPSALDIVTTQSQQVLANQLSKLEEFKEKTLTVAKQINDAIRNGIVNTISSSIQSVTTALFTGGDAFAAFAGTVLGIVGDLAIQIGGTLVSLGLGIDALKASLLTLSGGFAIAAGVALIAAGAALKAIATKGGGAKVASGASLTSPLTPAQPVSGNISDQVSERQASVSVVIQGNVFDSDSTGLRIASILKEQGYANAVRV